LQERHGLRHPGLPASRDGCWEDPRRESGHLEARLHHNPIGRGPKLPERRGGRCQFCSYMTFLTRQVLFPFCQAKNFFVLDQKLSLFPQVSALYFTLFLLPKDMVLLLTPTNIFIDRFKSRKENI